MTQTRKRVGGGIGFSQMRDEYKAEKAYEQAEQIIRDAVEKRKNTIHLSGLPLTKLPPIPEGILSLYIYGTKIKKLPALPSSITNLYVNYNPYLQELTSLPENLRYFECHNNNLLSLPE